MTWQNLDIEVAQTSHYLTILLTQSAKSRVKWIRIAVQCNAVSVPVQLVPPVPVQEIPPVLVHEVPPVPVEAARPVPVHIFALNVFALAVFTPECDTI